jgi:hypothetical protein
MPTPTLIRAVLVTGSYRVAVIEGQITHAVCPGGEPRPTFGEIAEAARAREVDCHG